MCLSHKTQNSGRYPESRTMSYSHESLNKYKQLELEIKEAAPCKGLVFLYFRNTLQDSAVGGPSSWTLTQGGVGFSACDTLALWVGVSVAVVFSFPTEHRCHRTCPTNGTEPTEQGRRARGLGRTWRYPLVTGVAGLALVCGSSTISGNEASHGGH